MKLTGNAIGKFLQQPSPDIPYILIYGPEEGLIAERTAALVKYFNPEADPLNITRLEGAAVKEDPAQLEAELNTPSLLGGGKQRVIVVRGIEAALAKPLEHILHTPPKDKVVALFMGGDLPPRSTCRKWFEAAKHAVALPCYKEEGPVLAAFARSVLQEAGYRIEQDALLLLQQLLPQNRLLWRQELEKIMLYSGESRHITEETIRLCLADNAESSLDLLCNAIASRRKGESMRLWQKACAEGVSPVAVQRALLRYFQRLYTVRAHTAEGVPEERAIGLLKPPVFFKQKPLLQQHIKQWRLSAIVNVLATLNQAESRCKQTDIPAETFCGQSLLKIMGSR